MNEMALVVLLLPPIRRRFELRYNGDGASINRCCRLFSLTSTNTTCSSKPKEAAEAALESSF